MKFSVLNSDNSFFKEKELNFVDLLSSSSLSTNTNENQSFVKDHLFYYEDKYTSDKDKSILNKNNNSSQITDIQTYIAETEKK